MGMGMNLENFDSTSVGTRRETSTKLSGSSRDDALASRPLIPVRERRPGGQPQRELGVDPNRPTDDKSCCVHVPYLPPSDMECFWV